MIIHVHNLQVLQCWHVERLTELENGVLQTIRSEISCAEEKAASASTCTSVLAMFSLEAAENTLKAVDTIGNYSQ